MNTIEKAFSFDYIGSFSSLQKQLFFTLLCLTVTSLIILYQNPEWGLVSVRAMRLRYALSANDHGKRNQFQEEGWGTGMHVCQITSRSTLTGWEQVEEKA